MVRKATVRTSHTDPLRIPLLDVPGLGGRVGLTLCPGKKGESLYGAPWDRDLALDVAAVRATGATALVTLLEPHEFEELGVPRLPEVAAAAGLEWHPLPIRDQGVPDAAFEARWVYAGTVLRERLRRGDVVVVHCRGGLGRAGTVAARLLIEAGVAPGEALARVRGQRPDAVENAVQESYVAACRAVDEAADRTAARRLAVLLGGALGDAFGYRVEFKRWDEIEREHGPSGIRLASAAGPLVVSDDTQMTLFTLEGLQRARATGAEPLEEIRRAYLDWRDSQRGGAPGELAGTLARHPLLRVTRAPGTTCRQALALGGTGTVERAINDSKGCGGVMRVAPVGFEPCTHEEAFALGVASAALTHGHPDGYLPAGVMAVLVRQVLAGVPLVDAVAGARTILAAWPHHARTDAVLVQALAYAGRRLSPGDLVRTLGQGWVGEEALAVALHAALTGDSFAEVLELASNHDGDSDSTASLAGQLYAGVHGPGVLPADAVYRLDALEPLLALVGSARARSGPLGQAPAHAPA